MKNLSETSSLINKTNQTFKTKKFLAQFGSTLRNINYGMMGLDFITGTIAGFSDEFNETIESRNGMTWLIPTYIAVSIAAICWDSIVKKLNSSTLNFRKPEINLLHQAINDDTHLAILKFNAIEGKRKRIKAINMNINNIPLFLLLTGLHIFYIANVLTTENYDNKSWFVENFDWLCPNIGISAMVVLAAVSHIYSNKQKQALEIDVLQFQKDHLEEATTSLNF